MGKPPLASEPRRARVAVRRALAAGLSLGGSLALAGCGQNASINPVQWWQGLQGGVLAQQRPPPPNADMPYPNLGTVPKKPAMPDPAARQKVSSLLAADRANAQYAVKLIPIPAARHAATPLGLPGAPGNPAAPADQSQASASLDAVTAPPGSPGPAGAPGRSAKAGPPGLPPSAPIDTGPMPTVPSAPPPPPVLSGYVIPLTKPTPPPIAPPERPKVGKLTGIGARPVALGFAPNSAVLTPDDIGALRALAHRRGAHQVEAVGFGDAYDATPQVQSAGIDLALARARAIVAALNVDGVPPQAVRMSAEASGSGGAARLLD